MLAFTPMPEKPDFSKTADFVQNRYDYGNSPIRFLKKDEFITALLEGKFDSSNPKIAYQNKKYPYDPKLPLLNGVITLNDGTLYNWKINRKGIIEIEDSQYRTGYIFYPKELLDLSSR